MARKSCRIGLTTKYESNKKALIRYANIRSRSSSLITSTNQQVIFNFLMFIFYQLEYIFSIKCNIRNNIKNDD